MNVLTEIHKAKTDFCRQNGRFPKRVYLGADEIKELSSMIDVLHNTSVDSATVTHGIVGGLLFYKVSEDSHLFVA